MGEMRNGFFVANTIPFSYNWNNKLANQAFTTLRLNNDNLYEIGKMFNVVLKGKKLGVAELRDKKTILLKDLDPFITFLDTGFGVDQTKRMLMNMYKKYNIDWETKKLDYCLFLFQRQKEFYETLPDGE
jgi:hypothetical protein